MYTLIIIFFVFLNIANVYSQDIDGFDFEDNKAQKYLTEKNGVAKISVKERISLSAILIIYFWLQKEPKKCRCCGSICGWVGGSVCPHYALTALMKSS